MECKCGFSDPSTIFRFVLQARKLQQKWIHKDSIELICRKFFIYTLGLFFTVFSILVSTNKVVGSASNDSPGLSVQPRELELVLNQTGVVGIEIDDGEDIYAFDIIITYDPKIVKLHSWTKGTYFPNLAVIINQTASGMLHVAATQLGEFNGTGKGTLLTLEFVGTSAGISDIAFEKAELSNSIGEIITPVLETGRVYVVTSLISPTPSKTFTATITPFRTQTLEMTGTTVSTFTFAPVNTQFSTQTPIPQAPAESLTTTTVNTVSVLSSTPNPYFENADPSTLSRKMFGSSRGENLVYHDVDQRTNRILWSIVVIVIFSLISLLIWHYLILKRSK